MLQRPIAALILLLPLGGPRAAAPAGFDPGLAGFTINAKGVSTGYREFALFALPGESVAITTDPSMHFQVMASGGEWQERGAGRWTWRAPAAAGDYPIDIVRDDGARMRLEAFVMVSARRVHDGRLNGYRIGHYPQTPLDGLAIYRAPQGFVEVTPALAGVHVSPHFTLGQFLCKQSGGYPKYLVLRPQLLLKLEALMAYLDTQGVAARAVHVMSGYRTPAYNERLGDARYSRHMWGDAADLYIEDSGVNGRYLDSGELAGDFDGLFHQPAYAYLRGGIGAYPATSAHAPFVHVDARGFDARW